MQQLEREMIEDMENHLFGDASSYELILIHSTECREIGGWFGLERPMERSIVLLFRCFLWLVSS